MVRPFKLPLAMIAVGALGLFASAGPSDAIRTWIVPDTPNGLHSNQNWHAIGSTPGGDIVIAGMDHVTNSALFRLNTRAGELE